MSNRVTNHVAFVVDTRFQHKRHHEAYVAAQQSLLGALEHYCTLQMGAALWSQVQICFISEQGHALSELGPWQAKDFLRMLHEEYELAFKTQHELCKDRIDHLLLEIGRNMRCSHEPRIVFFMFDYYQPATSTLERLFLLGVQVAFIRVLPKALPVALPVNVNLVDLAVFLSGFDNCTVSTTDDELSSLRSIVQTHLLAGIESRPLVICFGEGSNMQSVDCVARRCVLDDFEVDSEKSVDTPISMLVEGRCHVDEISEAFCFGSPVAVTDRDAQTGLVSSLATLLFSQNELLIVSTTSCIISGRADVTRRLYVLLPSVDSGALLAKQLADGDLTLPLLHKSIPLEQQMEHMRAVLNAVPQGMPALPCQRFLMRLKSSHSTGAIQRRQTGSFRRIPAFPRSLDEQIDQGTHKRVKQ